MLPRMTRSAPADPAPIDDEAEATGRFAAFQSPTFRLLMGAGMAMQLGQWIQRVALLWVVYEITGSAIALSVLGFLSNVFVIVLSPFAGIASDRFGARRVLLFAAVGQAAGAGILAVAIFTDRASLPLLYAIGATFGIGQALNQPTRNLLVYDTVGRRLLRNGLALNAMTGSTMRVLGPSVAGVIIARWGGGFAFAIQAVLLFAAVGLVWALKVETRRDIARGNVWRERLGGVAHLRENGAVRLSVLMNLLTALLVYPYLAFMPVFVRENIGGGEAELGYLLSAVGVGSLIGLWYVAAGRGGIRSMLWAGVIYVLLVLAFTQATHFPLAFGILVVAGVVHSVFSTLNQALVQLNASEQYRARVMGIYSMSQGAEPIGTLSLGPLIAVFGVTIAMGTYMGLAAAVMLATAVVVTLRGRRPAAA